MNKVVLVGRLTADPELRQTQSGIASCRFTVAANRQFADKNTGERQADFIQCQAWRQTAEFVSRYFNKGKLICVEGALQNNNYQDKNYPDITHYGMLVNVNNVEFVGGKNDNGGGNGQASAPVAAPTTQQPQNNGSMTYGNLSDFEEILSDGSDVPF